MERAGASQGGLGNGNGSAPPHGDGGFDSSGPDEVFRRLTDRPADLLRFATAGSVDDGKSTLIGRLLYDSKQVLVDQLEHVEQTSKRMGHDFVDLSLLTDDCAPSASRASRSSRLPLLRDRAAALHHRRHARARAVHPQHVTGAPRRTSRSCSWTRARALWLSPSGTRSSARCSRSARGRVREQDGPRRLQESIFDEIVEDFDRFAARLEMPDVTFIPISALLGDNVVERSENMPWYQGPPLLYHSSTCTSPPIATSSTCASPCSGSSARSRPMPLTTVPMPGRLRERDPRGRRGARAAGSTRTTIAASTPTTDP